MANIVYHGTVAAHTDEKQPVEGQTDATRCSICHDWFKPVPTAPSAAYLQAAQMALLCQDASNLSGVAKSFAGPVMDALWEESRRIGKGTDWVNQHPIVTLFLDKLASLNRSQFENKFSQAYAAVTAIVEGKQATP